MFWELWIREVFSRFLREILKNDVVSGHEASEELVMQGRELGQFVSDLPGIFEIFL